MARAAVLAAGGIVLRQEATPLIAVVRLRKRNEWVLPKGKLDDGETPRDAAEREVLEETGHDVSVHEFLGTLVYESGGRFKVVHYWRMETSGGPTHELMDDIRAVDWLPLDAAVERLSRAYVRAFLANVGPISLESAALARRLKARKQPVPEKRRRPPAVAPQPSMPIPAPVAPPPDLTPSLSGNDEPLIIGSDVVEARSEIQSEAHRSEAQSPVDSTTPEITAPLAQDIAAATESVATEMQPPSDNQDAVESGRGQRVNLVQKVRDWLRRAA
jgi:8-oxo-dGTP diphosphatase